MNHGNNVGPGEPNSNNYGLYDTYNYVYFMGFINQQTLLGGPTLLATLVYW